MFTPPRMRTTDALFQRMFEGIETGNLSRDSCMLAIDAVQMLRLFVVTPAMHRIHHSEAVADMNTNRTCRARVSAGSVDGRRR